MCRRAGESKGAVTDRYHVIAVGTEECENTIAKSAVVTSKKKWEAAIGDALGPCYALLRAHTLQATHLAVFVHRAVLPLVPKGSVASAAVATGLGGALARMGNKGGIGVTLALGSTSLCFVNAHLAAHQASDACWFYMPVQWLVSCL